MNASRVMAACVSAVCVTALSLGYPDAATADPVASSNGATRVAKWKDDKQAAILLTFDDSLDSQIHNAVPELKKRDLVGTFYVVPGGGQWKARKDIWEKTFPKEFPAMGMEYGNHTLTHHGAKDAADFDAEVSQCNDVILKLFPGKTPRLVSFAIPGVKKEDWNITADQEKEILAKHNLFRRPEYAIMAVGYYTTADHMMAMANDGIKKGDVKCYVFHGVGGNYLSTAMPTFTDFLDKLAAKREQLWITTAIPEHKYAIERDGAAVKVVQADARQIQLQLTSKADPALYDYPLTLITQVPAAWKTCRITQGATQSTVQPTGGSVRYDALPNGAPVTIEAGG